MLDDRGFDKDAIWNTIRTNFGARDVFDILLLTLAIYYVLRLLRGTRAIQLIKGLLVLGVLILATGALGLETFHMVLRQALLPGVIVLVILFTPELRMALEQIGRGTFWSPPSFWLHREEVARVVNEIVRAVRQFSQERTGALLVIAGRVGLGEVIETGRQINGLVSNELLRTIFFPGSPLHDLAVVVRGDRVVAAGCLLPLTERQDIGVTLGTRHRAALGLSEVSDAAIIVVSEETGAISLAREAKLFRNLSHEALKQKLLDLLSPPRRPGRRWLRRRKTDVAPRS
jgi:diadenylate cyclase